MGSRRLVVLLRGLMADPTTTLHRKINDGWTLQDHLLAGISDDIRLANYYFIIANTPKNKANDIVVPPHIPRPGVRERDNGKVTKTTGKTTKSPEEVRAMLALYDPVEE